MKLLWHHLQGRMKKRLQTERQKTPETNFRAQTTQMMIPKYQITIDHIRSDQVESSRAVEVTNGFSQIFIKASCDRSLILLNSHETLLSVSCSLLFVYCLLLLLLCSQGAVPSDSEVQADVAERDRPAVAGCLLVRISTGNCTADSEHNTDSSLTASPLIKLLFSLYLYMSMYLMYWILDTLGLRMQGEFGVLVLPERVWTEEHVQPHPGTGQRWVWLLWRCLSQSVRFMFDHDPKLIPQIHLQRFSHKTVFIHKL